MSQHETERTSALLRVLVESIDARRSPDHPDIGKALCAFGQLARLQIPAGGVFPLSNDQLFDAIDGVAVTHLDLSGARAALDAALAVVEPLSSRNEIEVGVDHLCAVLNVAYFHAGLAFGVTLADLKSL